MALNHHLKVTLALTFAFHPTAALNGQHTPPPTSSFGALPNVVLHQAAALGERVRTGKEKIVFDGHFVDASGNRPAKVTYQVPGLVRLDGFKSGSARLAFDGERSYGVGTALDDAFLETFTIDTTEGLLAATRLGAGLRLLGRQFQPNPRSFPKYTGPRYDIYEVAVPVRSRSDRAVRLKRYYFDSKSGWLVRTRYRDDKVLPRVTVETRFSGWRTVDGSAYPERIDRYENGRPVFSFVTSTISTGPRVEPAEFR
jgi:hypothetical protein